MYIGALKKPKGLRLLVNSTLFPVDVFGIGFNDFGSLFVNRQDLTPTMFLNPVSFLSSR